MCGINLTGLLDCGNLGYTAKEDEQVTTFFWGIALVNALQGAQVGSGVQFLRARYLLLRWDRLVYHLSTEGSVCLVLFLYCLTLVFVVSFV